MALRSGPRADWSAALTLEYGIGIVLSLLLLGYLVYAILKPERF